MPDKKAKKKSPAEGKQVIPSEQTTDLKKINFSVIKLSNANCGCQYDCQNNDSRISILSQYGKKGADREPNRNGIEGQHCISMR